MRDETLKQLDILIKAQKNFSRLRFQKKGDGWFFSLELIGGDLCSEELVDFAVVELNKAMESFFPEIQRRISKQIRTLLADVEEGLEEQKK